MTAQSTHVLDKNIKMQAYEFLTKHRKMVISELDVHGHPTSSMVLYVVDSDMNIYFGTRKSFGKYKALLTDEHVSIAIIQGTLDPLQFVDMQGVANEIDESKRAQVLKLFDVLNDSTYFIRNEPDFTMFVIVPTAAHWLDATSGEIKMYDLLQKNV